MTEEQHKIIEKTKNDNIKEIQLHFTDLFGAIKSISISASRLEEALEKGVWFDGSSIEGFTRIMESDMYLMLDQSTYRVVPWENGVARFICDVYRPDGKPYEGDPRYILRKVVQEARELGYMFNVGPEPEFYFYEKKDGGALKVHDQAGYFDLAPNDLGRQVRREAVDNLVKMGLEVEASHHEVGPGQHEIDFKYADALSTADNLLTFKYVVKVIAQKNGLIATFMPKPESGITGSGMHVHQSLFDAQGNNIFYDNSDSYGLSKLAKGFIAGQLQHVSSIMALISPSANSYKRLVPGYEAPVYITWAQMNRSSLIRVPRTFKDNPKSARVEIRCPDPSANPYLAFASLLKAGIAGMQGYLTPPAPVEEDVYKFNNNKLIERGIKVLPESLGHAIKEMEKGTLVKDTLGGEAYEKYLRAKRMEWDQIRMHVSPWERERYFNV